MSSAGTCALGKGESDFREQAPNEDGIEAGWEQALREGCITREQFAQRRHGNAPGTAQPEFPDQGAVIRSAVEKLRAKLANSHLSAEERADGEHTMATLENVLKGDRTCPTDHAETADAIVGDPAAVVDVVGQLESGCTETPNGRAVS